ncbi:MAG: RodZ domain-containing protein [Alphaproteobacteria bacterium]
MELSAQAIEFGAALRDMRVAHGRELPEVAETLRIRPSFLQAIEDGRFQELPGTTYASGFVRAYADYLGLDVPEVMRRYREASGSDGLGAPVPLVPPSPMAEGRMPTGFILLVAVILAAIVYGGWYYLTLNGRDAGEVIAELPRQLAEMVGMESGPPPSPPGAPESTAPAPEATPEPAPTAEAPAQSTPVESPAPPTPAPVAETTAPEPAPVAEVTAPEPATVAEATAPELATEPEPAAQPEPAPVVEAPAAEPAPEPAPVASVAPEPAPEPAAQPTPAPEPAASIPEPVAESLPSAPPPAQVAVAAPESLNLVGRVVLRAASASWVELRDEDNRRVFSRLMRAGEIYAVPPGRPVMLTTGNAGGLDILIDGQLIPSLGPIGDVRRDVSLEPAALLSRLRQ